MRKTTFLRNHCSLCYHKFDDGPHSEYKSNCIHTICRQCLQGGRSRRRCFHCHQRFKNPKPVSLDETNQKIVLKADELEVECNICLQHFEEDRPPKMGYCGHSVCASCADKVKPMCPICAQRTFGENPPTNFQMKDLLEKLESIKQGRNVAEPRLTPHGEYRKRIGELQLAIAEIANDIMGGDADEVEMPPVPERPEIIEDEFEDEEGQEEDGEEEDQLRIQLIRNQQRAQALRLEAYQMAFPGLPAMVPPEIPYNAMNQMRVQQQMNVVVAPAPQQQFLPNNGVETLRQYNTVHAPQHYPPMVGGYLPNVPMNPVNNLHGYFYFQQNPQNL